MTTAVDVDDLTDLIEAWDDAPQCDHSQHETLRAAHHGDAEWEATHTCRGCGRTTTGIRCNAWYKFCLTTRGQVYCTICDRTQTTYDYFRDTHWRKL